MTASLQITGTLSQLPPGRSMSTWMVAQLEELGTSCDEAQSRGNASPHSKSGALKDCFLAATWLACCLAVLCSQTLPGPTHSQL